MSEERNQFAQRINERKFSMSRRGYDKGEVKSYLEDLEQAFRELEGHSRRASQRVSELESDLSKARATEKVSVDNAMMAVFDAKDRILERARRKAEELEEEARLEAGRIRVAAIADAENEEGAGAGQLAAARAQADEIVASAKREAERIQGESVAMVGDDAEAEFAEMNAQLRRAHGDTAAARAELEEARKRIVDLEAAGGSGEAEDLTARFAELEGHAGRLRQELELERTQLEAMRTATAAAEQARDAYGDRQSELEADLAASRAELEAAGQVRLQLEEQIQDLQVEAAAKVAHAESMQAQIAAGEALRDELDAAQARIVELQLVEQAHGESVEQVHGLEADLATKTAEMKRLRAQVAAGEALREELDVAQVQVAELGVVEQARVELEERVGGLESELAAKTAELDVAQVQVAELGVVEQARVEFEERVRALEGDLEARVAELAAAEVQVAELGAVEHARVELQERIEGLESELAAKAAELATAEVQVAELGVVEQARVELQERVEGLESELAAKAAESDQQHHDHEEAAAAREALEKKLAKTERQAQSARDKLINSQEEIDQLRNEAAVAAAAGEEAKRLENALGAEKESSRVASFVSRMNGFQTHLVASLGRQDVQAMTSELDRSLRPGTVARIDAEKRVEQLESNLADAAADATAVAAGLDEANSQAEQIIAAAREEAEAIQTEAEEEADQRAAKVISRAREEADQVRQTVATLTAQAEDARSAALRSKLEAENLVEAQRSMSGARDDIVAAAESRAGEMHQDAERAVTAAETEADKLLQQARDEAARITAEAEEAALTRLREAEEAASGRLRETEDVAQARLAEAEEQATARISESDEAAQARLSEAEQRASKLVAAAEEEARRKDEAAATADADETADGEDLAALLAEAEQEVAMSEELRLRRQELEELEAGLAAQERAVAAQQAEAAMLLASARQAVTSPETPSQEETATSTTDVVADFAATGVDLDTEAVRDDAVEPATSAPVAEDDETDDPAERLTALLESMSPEEEPDDEEETEPVDLDEVSRGSDDEPKPRFAWPSPMDPADEESGGDQQRESRYRSRSAQLPRLGKQAKSNMTTMANLRKKSRNKD